MNNNLIKNEELFGNYYNKNLFASKHQLYLPTEKELALEIEKQKAEFNDKN